MNGWTKYSLTHARLAAKKMDDLQLLQDHLCTLALNKAFVLKYVVEKWRLDDELKNSLSTLKEHISAVITYELRNYWGQSQPEHKDYMDVFYEDWLKRVAE